MYSRNRVYGGEDNYRGNLPPHYSGNLFRAERAGGNMGIRAADERRPPPPPEQLPVPGNDAEKCAESSTPSAPGRLPAAIGDLLSGIGQEELLLITLLLLLSAEHDRAMDIIIVLLLLLGVQ